MVGLVLSQAGIAECCGGCRVTTILGVRGCLKFVLGREQVAHPKPDPAIYLAAAKGLGVPPERCNLQLSFLSPIHSARAHQGVGIS